jgi:lipoprotein-releasing system permease protein
MNYKLIIDIAQSLLLARWKQTLVAAIGVTFSITMFITLLSFMTGLNVMLDSLILNRTPHIKLFNEIKPSAIQPIQGVDTLKTEYHFIHSIKSNTSRQEIYNSGKIIQTLKSDNRVSGIAPKIFTQVFFNDGSIEIAGVINGIDIQAEMQLFHFNDYVTIGNPSDIKNISNSIILGKGLADKLLVKMGDMVYVTTIKGESFPLKVVGLFQSGIQEFDKVQSYVALETTQKMIGQSKNYITDIQIKLKDIELAPAVAREYASLFNTEAEDIQTANSQFETGSFIRSLISYVVGITLLVVAGFGIYNILNMMIYEKMDSIAILKATGFSGGDVNKIFITIALAIGLFGGTLGLILGYGLSTLISHIPFNTAALPTIKTYPINFDPAFYIIGGIFATVTTYLAGLFPANKASKVDPVEIIRGK